MKRIAHTIPPSYPARSENKFSSLIELEDASGYEIAIIGIPDDTGVRLNNGRPGAALGPNEIRANLAKMGVADPSSFKWPRVYDAGDIEVVPGDLHTTHERVTTVTLELLNLGLFPIAIGGGHDLTFPFVRAVSEKFGKLHGVYFDPHLDVREQDGSGMPFRKLLETGAAESLRIHGFDAMLNTQEHTHWFKSNNGIIDEISTPEDRFPKGSTFVSLDMDVIDAAYAPGVSAPNPCGWDPQLAARWVQASGRCPEVRCFDIMECSPVHDDHGRTSKLAARMLLTFLRGYSERQP